MNLRRRVCLVRGGLVLAVALVTAGCGGPFFSYFNNTFDGEKGSHFESTAAFDLDRIERVVVVAPFETGPRGAIICCGKDASAFANKFHDVSGLEVTVAQLPNGARSADYRRLLAAGERQRFADALGISADFDAVMFGSVVEHEAFIRAVHGYSADITMTVDALAADGSPLFEASSRVQYPGDTIARESAKVITEHMVGRR